MARQEFPDSLGVKNPFSCHCRRPSQSSGEIFCFVSFLKGLIPGGFPRGSVERSPPASWVQSLDQEDPLEKAMATHSSILAWKIPWIEEPGGLQSMGLQRVGHTERFHFHFSLFMYWRRKWQPTPVFLPGESQRQQSLVGCHLWGRIVGHD